MCQLNEILIVVLIKLNLKCLLFSATVIMRDYVNAKAKNTIYFQRGVILIFNFWVQRCVISEKGADLIYYAAEAWNHA
jgi:hypothetical protein